jgi:hypothetical protein
MNETKVNTKISEVISASAKKSAAPLVGDQEVPAALVQAYLVLDGEAQALILNLIQEYARLRVDRFCAGSYGRLQ